jgi:hypothetical protein
VNYKKLLDDFQKGPVRLRNKVDHLSEEVLNFRPNAESWTIKEHVIHVVDSEINNFIRWKSILAQPGSIGFVIKQDTWTRNLQYYREDMNKYLTVFSLLREISYEYLLGVEDSKWEKDYYIHEWSGEVTLIRCIQTYSQHVDDHLKYIDRNLGEWEKR